MVVFNRLDKYFKLGVVQVHNRVKFCGSAFKFFHGNMMYVYWMPHPLAVEVGRPIKFIEWSW